MKTSRIKDWPQLLATVGVFIGLLFVAFEIRESNRIAKGESIREIQDKFRQIELSQYTTNIHEIFIKSIESPQDLSSAEILKMESYLIAVIGSYEDWWRMSDLGLSDYDGLEDLRGEVDYHFSTEFGRAWFAQNSWWLWPEVAETIEKELQSLPVRTTPPSVEYYRSRISMEQ